MKNAKTSVATKIAPKTANAKKTIMKLLTLAEICESLKISQKVARAKLRRANARANAELYDASTKTWRSVSENSDAHKQYVQILRGTAKK